MPIRVPSLALLAFFALPALLGTLVALTLTLDV